MKDENEAKTTNFSDPSPPEPDLPGKPHGFPCGRSDCPAPEFEVGFGLAGGGYGAYEFCDVCGIIVSKTQEPSDAE